MVDAPLTPWGAAAEGAIGSEQPYLLCIAGERSWRIPIPEGELVIGRAQESGLVLDDERVSRAHARLLPIPDGLELTDLRSRHGTTVNGKRIAQPAILGSGDVITIGGTVLIVHRPTQIAGMRALVDRRGLQGRLEEEIERALRYQRELGIAVLRAPAALDAPRVAAVLAGHLRLMDSAAILDDHELALLLPEIGLDEAHAVISELIAVVARVAPGLAGALAGSPADGIDAEGLLSAASAAAARTKAGEIAFVRDGVRRLDLGSRTVTIADPAMSQIYDLARRLARSPMPILIRGETGVGKELAAAAVHTFSERGGPLVSINCAAIPEALAESELFGHVKGAFSGAIAAKEGQLELANGGTVFLDEVGDLPLAVQAKLLRVVENRELTRVGDVRVRPIDVRIVAATNRDLERDIEAGRFRRDLYFRLAAGQLLLPPLRDRRRDLAYLSGQLLADACAELGRNRLALSVAAMQAVLLHRWPGNVRELRHAMSFAATNAPEKALEIEVWHLPATVTETAHVASEKTAPMTSSAASIGRTAATPSTAVPVRREPTTFRPIADEVRELERRRMVEALIATRGLQNQAAALIEMPLRTFVTKLKRYGVTSDEWAPQRE